MLEWHTDECYINSQLYRLTSFLFVFASEHKVLQNAEYQPSLHKLLKIWSNLIDLEIAAKLFFCKQSMALKLIQTETYHLT